MPSWAIVGATRGIGFEFVNQLSSDSTNVVLALIRSQSTAGPLNELAAFRKNIHVLQTDTSSPELLNETAEAIGRITGGKLDVLINNAYMAVTETMELSPSKFTGKQEMLEKEIFEPLKVNAIHVMYTINAFLPLIRKGEMKKIVYISAGAGDIKTTRVCELPTMLGYSVGKAAGNIIMAKYSVELKTEGILILAMSPGWVETDAARKFMNSPEAIQAMRTTLQKLDPRARMISTSESVKAQLGVINSLDANMSGNFVSHHGNTEDWF